MLWCSLYNQLITLPISHYGGRVVNASDYGSGGTSQQKNLNAENELYIHLQKHF